MKFIKNLAISLLLSAGMTNALQEAKDLPMPRTTAPSFTGVNAVINNEFKQVSLSDYKGKYVVLIFYPFDYTYVCPTELIAFSDSLAKFQEIGAEILGISVDSHFTHLAWIKQDRKQGGLGKIDYPLLADISKDISADYGVLVTEEGDPMRGAALRGLFILDGDHKVRSVQVNDDAVGRSVDDALRLIQGFQYSDKHGEVCPAGWKPGDKTIKPDQIAKNEFFSQAYTDKPKSQFPETEPTDKSKFTVTRLNEGTPGAHPPKGKNIKAHYTGTLLDGTQFDSSRDRGQPFQFTLGVGQVIPCWDQGFAKLVKGQKAILNCPHDMAYGERGFPPVIPAKATLRFDVELIDF